MLRQGNIIIDATNISAPVRKNKAGQRIPKCIQTRKEISGTLV